MNTTTRWTRKMMEQMNMTWRIVRSPKIKKMTTICRVSMMLKPHQFSIDTVLRDHPILSLQIYLVIILNKLGSSNQLFHKISLKRNLVPLLGNAKDENSNIIDLMVEASHRLLSNTESFHFVWRTWKDSYIKAISWTERRHLYKLIASSTQYWLKSIPRKISWRALLMQICLRNRRRSNTLHYKLTNIQCHP